MDNQGGAVKRKYIVLQAVKRNVFLNTRCSFSAIPWRGVYEPVDGTVPGRVPQLLRKFLFQLSDVTNGIDIFLGIQSFVEVFQDDVVEGFKTNGAQKHINSHFAGYLQRLL